MRSGRTSLTARAAPNARSKTSQTSPNAPAPRRRTQFQSGMRQRRKGRERGFSAVRRDATEVANEQRVEIPRLALEVQIGLDLRLQPPQWFQSGGSNGFLQHPFNL